MIIAAGLAVAACGKGEQTTAAPTTPAAPAPAATPAAAPLVVAYDEVREALAKDDLKDAQARAKALGEGAGKDHPAMVAAVGKLTAMADIEDARQAFGDLSKALLEVLAKDAKLAEGVIAFRCPMALGYQKWAQIAPKEGKAAMRNPYMGQKMLECGSKVDLTP
ncbi:MAG: DUF3347 domain-containing protein [Deltaproteobacteria bacterium]|nr:DUF3347 domain-containing protein [Deltaproteobacteria bacterium]